MTETAPKYIPDTRFAAKLQELINEYAIESLAQAEYSEHFMEGLVRTYMEHNGEWLDSVYWDEFVTSREERVQNALATDWDTGRQVLMDNYLLTPYRRIFSTIFEDFSGYWDSGEADEVIPYANCIPCVKATSPDYWAMVRHVNPVEFERMVELSRRLGARLARLDGERIFIDEIPEDQPMTEPLAPECDFLCNIAEQEIYSEDAA